MKIIRIVKDWDWPDILRQTPGGIGVWGDIRFTTGDIEQCDALVVLNNRMKHAVHARCPTGRVWALMQEPYAKGVTDWMAEGHGAFDRVYTNYIPSSDQKYVTSQPALPWHVNRTFDELTTCTMPQKSRALSWIVGNIRDMAGHRKRGYFLRAIQSEQMLGIDLYGRAIKFIEDKWDGLAPYRYSIAAENTVWPDYWTEKIADCFLSWTIPFYYGCENLEKYFPADSFIRIDIEKPGEAIDIIRKTLAEDNWERRLPALEEARRRVLFEYQMFPHLSKLFREVAGAGAELRSVTIPPYRRSLKAKLWRRVGKIEAALQRAKGKYL